MELLMDAVDFLTKLRKILRDSYQQIGDSMIAGGIKDMEGYKYQLGQAHAYQYIDQEITNLLNPKEKKNDTGTVVQLDPTRGPKA
ncbi:MAG: hypothetical protein VW262_08675 [Flavobacteriaceae bacterium]